MGWRPGLLSQAQAVGAGISADRRDQGEVLRVPPAKMADRATQGLLERFVMAGPERFFQDFGAGTLARPGASLRTLAELQEVSGEVGPQMRVLDPWMEFKAQSGP